MPRLRKSTWAILIWTLLCGLVTIAWMSTDVTKESSLPLNQAVEVDDEFRITLLSENPPTFSIENLTTSNAYFDYSNVTMLDSAGGEHEPRFGLDQIGDDVPASSSLTKVLDFGNIGSASAQSYSWECDACSAGEAIGRGVVFVLMGGVYWLGAIVLFVIWLVSRSPRVIRVVVESSPAAESAT